MRVLVTGGTGYLGQAIVRALVGRGHEAVVFARRLKTTSEVVFISGDVRDRDAVVAAARGCDALIHTAALVSIWRPNSRDFDDINVGGLHHAVEAVRTHGLHRLVYTSSFLALPPAGRDVPLVANDYQRTKAAARLVAERKYSMAIDALRDITRVHPQLAVVHYQTGSLLARAGRLPEADHAFRAAASIAPDSTDIQVALAELLLREGREADAAARAALAVALAEHQDGRARASAHWMAVLVALARDDEESAQAHAVAAEIDDPTLPMVRVVAGRLAHTEGRYEEALTAFESAAATLTRGQRALEGVYWHLGEILVRLNRGADAEKAFREELRAFPRGIRAYTSLAMAYHAADRADAVRETLDALLVAVPTPEGYDAAARTWTAVGDASRATALRTAARTRFRGDPSLAVFQRRR